LCSLIRELYPGHGFSNLPLLLREVGSVGLKWLGVSAAGHACQQQRRHQVTAETFHVPRSSLTRPLDSTPRAKNEPRRRRRDGAELPNAPLAASRPRLRQRRRRLQISEHRDRDQYKGRQKYL